jgi:Acetyltransferase (GNAT) domain
MLADDTLPMSLSKVPVTPRPQMTLSNSSWQQRDIHLEFRLGELRLKRVTFRGMVATSGLVLESGHLRPGRVADSVVPELPPGLDVALVHSYPSANLGTRYEAFGHVFRYVPHHYDRYYVDLSGTFDDYMKKIPGKSRYTLRKKLHRFKAASGDTLHWEEYRRPGEMTAFHSLARMISATTHQERQLQAGIPRHQSFLDEMHRLAEGDSVRGYILFLGEEPVSYMHCTAEGEGLLSGYVGYSPKYKTLSPGVVLQYLLLERLFSEKRFRFLDFGWGGSQHKRLFATGCVACTDLYYFRKSRRHFTIVKLHSFLESLSGGAAAMLQALGVKSQVNGLLARFVREPLMLLTILLQDQALVC